MLPCAVTVPGCLNETSSPCSPMLGVEVKGMLQIRSALKENTSTSDKAFTVLIDNGRLVPDFGSKAHVCSSSP
ncbi:hypothetical protein SUGI_0985970 [Cryptomeria japonica]|nr:hypothetical protein SUGI_0985970 [Cryptomeria japonica]